MSWFTTSWIRPNPVQLGNIAKRNVVNFTSIVRKSALIQLTSKVFFLFVQFNITFLKSFVVKIVAFGAEQSA